VIKANYRSGFLSSNSIESTFSHRGSLLLKAEKQLEISRWFGEVESTFYKHPVILHNVQLGSALLFIAGVSVIAAHCN
jgi:hypothetical protein